MVRLAVLSILVSLLVLPAQANAFPSVSSFGFAETVALVERFDAAYDAIPEGRKVGISTQAEVNQWVNEVVPFFEYEGMSDADDLVYPPIEFTYYDNGLYHNHVLGTTSCLSQDVTLNGRMANPASSWYGRLDSISTLIHELAHAQGICWGSVNFDQEMSAQLVTLEILASLTNKGSEVAFVVLVGELRDISLSAAKYAAAAEGRDADYAALLDEVLSPFERAAYAKSDRYWQDDPERLTEILYRYNFMPLQAVLAAIQADQSIEGVELPINYFCDYAIRADEYGGYAGYQGESYETEEEEEEGSSEPICELLPLAVDDLAYVYEHFDALLEVVSNG